MGIIRKTMSVSSLGLVDFRSDKERNARYSRQTRNAVRAQSKMQADLAQQQAQAAYQQAAIAQQQMNIAAAHLAVAQNPTPQPQQIPAGWYANLADNNPALLRWWDGLTWTQHTQPAPVMPPPPQGQIES